MTTVRPNCPECGVFPFNYVPADVPFKGTREAKEPWPVASCPNGHLFKYARQHKDTGATPGLVVVFPP